MWRRESDDMKPSIYPTTLCDYITGMHLMQGILLALRTRETTGEGQKVEVTMYDSMLHMQMQEACMQLNRGYEVNWGAMPLTGVFETTDGAVCMVGAFNPDPLPRISEALGLDEDLSLRPEFANLRAAVRAQAGTAGDLPRALRHQHHRVLDRPAGGPGTAQRPGAHPGAGAGGRADRRPTA